MLHLLSPESLLISELSQKYYFVCLFVCLSGWALIWERSSAVPLVCLRPPCQQLKMLSYRVFDFDLSNGLVSLASLCHGPTFKCCLWVTS